MERPAFRLRPVEGRSPLRAGWYRIGFDLGCRDDRRPAPVLDVAYVGGQRDTGVPVHAAGGDRFHSIVLFAHDVATLNLLPGCGGMGFRLAEAELTPVSRIRALASLLAGPGRHMLSPTAALRFAGVLRSEGLGSAVVDAYQRYRGEPPASPEVDYQAWANAFDVVDAECLARLKQKLEALNGFRPKVSLLVPVYATPLPLLQRCIDSVKTQAYDHWQLCMVDDASPDPQVYELLLRNAEQDPRIVVARREQNGHIVRTSNAALALADGDWIGLLDHDDELRPHALAEMVLALAEHPRAGLLYSDEDKLNAEDRRFDPYFKPDFDIELLRGQNYLCHFTMIAAWLVREAGGFREGYEGSQDHDLFLRCVERLRAEQVVHVPRVLYHWRAIAGSTALSREAKDYAGSAGARAVAAHLQRRHPQARVEELNHGHYRVRWPLPSPPPKVSLIVPTRDRPELLETCVAGLLAQSTYPDFELLLVDNQSANPRALELLRELSADPRVKVLRYDAPFNYSAINNWAAAQAEGQVLALVNNDIEAISPDWLEEMVSQALRPEIGAVGAMLYYPDDTIQHAGVILGIHGVAAHVYCGLPRGYPGHGGRARVVQSLSAVTAACLVVRRELFERVDGLDERLQVAFNDIDFCLRLREAGYRNLWTPFAELYHHESASRGKEDTEEKRARFKGEVEFMQRRWGDALLSDPAYNPNLSLDSLRCDPAVPPRA